MAKITRSQVSLAGFQRAVAMIAKVAKKTFEEELNRNMLKLLVGAKGVKGLVQLTRKATESDIRADLGRMMGKRPLVYLLAVKHLRLTGQPITEASIQAVVQKIIAARVRSRAFMAASWLFSALDLAKSVPGSDLNRDGSVPMSTQATRKRASDADAKPATVTDLKCIVYNTADGAAKISGPAVPRALDNVRRDMMAYVARKAGENFARARRQ